MFRSLQTCRALAAILVVLFHLGLNVGHSKYFDWDALGRPFSFGHSGVHFFFVLSGFIIFHVHQHDIGHPEKLKTYLLKRVFRIYPVYWMIFYAVFIGSKLIPSMSSSTPHDLPTIVKSTFLMPQDPQVLGGTGSPVLVVAWTLQYEVLFYLGFALLILNRALGVCIWAGVIAAHFLLPEDATFPPNLIQSDWLLLFLLGAATSNLVNRPTKQIPTLFLAGAGALAFATIAIHETYPQGAHLPGQNFLYGLCSCLIIYGLVLAEKNGTVIGKGKFWQMLGASSYVLYLIHFPLISFLCKVSRAIGLRGHSGAMITYFALLAACLASAVLFHRLVEAPLLSRLSQWVKAKKDGPPLREVPTAQ